MSYYRKIGKAKSEELKLELFEGILDGKMKICPIHSLKYLSFGSQVVPIDFNHKKHTSRFRLSFSKEYQLDSMD